MSSDIFESSPLLVGRVDGGPWRISTDFIRSRIVCRVGRRKGDRFRRSLPLSGIRSIGAAVRVRCVVSAMLSEPSLVVALTIHGYLPPARFEDRSSSATDRNVIRTRFTVGNRSD